MREIIYAMQFSGRAAPKDAARTDTEADPLVLKATTSAPSCSLTTSVGAEGVRGTLQHAAGETAVFESEVTFTGESSFLEAGIIAFGRNGHRLYFSTVGQGYLGPSPDAGRKQGTVMWRVDGGEGQFAGARGLITSNFFVGEMGDVTDNHFGVIFVQ